MLDTNSTILILDWDEKSQTNKQNSNLTSSINEHFAKQTRGHGKFLLPPPNI